MRCGNRERIPMAKKYIKVDVTKTLSSEVYIEYDENDERFQGIIHVNDIKISGEETLAKLAAYAQSLAALKPFAVKAAKELADIDWDEYYAEYDVEMFNPCTEEEARQYSGLCKIQPEE